MRILIDECLPRDLKLQLAKHECRTVQEMGWSGKKNGALLALAKDKFDLLVTIDQGFRYSQSPKYANPFIFILKAKSNKMRISCR